MSIQFLFYGFLWTSEETLPIVHVVNTTGLVNVTMVVCSSSTSSGHWPFLRQKWPFWLLPHLPLQQGQAPPIYLLWWVKSCVFWFCLLWLVCFFSWPPTPTVLYSRKCSQSLSPSNALSCPPRPYFFLQFHPRHDKKTWPFFF